MAKRGRPYRKCQRQAHFNFKGRWPRRRAARSALKTAWWARSSSACGVYMAPARFDRAEIARGERWRGVLQEIRRRRHDGRQKQAVFHTSLARRGRVSISRESRRECTASCMLRTPWRKSLVNSAHAIPAPTQPHSYDKSGTARVGNSSSTAKYSL